MAVSEKITEIIVEQLGVKPEEVTPEASFVDDLGADSLDTVELVMALEEEFGIEVPDEEAEKLATVGDAIKYIELSPGKVLKGLARKTNRDLTIDILNTAKDLEKIIGSIKEEENVDATRR